MRVITKKTPLIIAGGELLRRRIKKVRAVRSRRPVAKRIVLATGALGAAGAVAMTIKRRKAESQQFGVTEPPGMGPNGKFMDIRETATAGGVSEARPASEN